MLRHPAHKNTLEHGLSTTELGLSPHGIATLHAVARPSGVALRHQPDVCYGRYADFGDASRRRQTVKTQDNLGLSFKLDHSSNPHGSQWVSRITSLPFHIGTWLNGANEVGREEDDAFELDWDTIPMLSLHAL